MPRLDSRQTVLSDTRPAARAVAAVVAGSIGLFVLFGVGFAHTAAVHDAAHDSRHSVAFPCH